MDYQTLRRDVINLLDDRSSQFAQVVGGFINDALRDIQRRRKWSASFAYKQFSITSGKAEYLLSDIGVTGYMMTDSLEITDGTTRQMLLKEHDWETFRNRKIEDENDTNTTGAPVSYFIATASTSSTGAKSLYLFPTPNGAYTADWWYYRFMPMLVNDTDRNWFTEEISDVIKYLSAVKGAVFLGADAGPWGQLYESSFNQAANLDKYEMFHKASIVRNKSHDYGIGIE